LRGLAISIASLTFAGGIISIVVPLIVLDGLGGSELAVGMAFALSGLAGLASVIWFGRRDTRGKEWRLVVIGMSIQIPATAFLWLADGTVGLVVPLVGYAAIGASLLLTGLLEGPLDIGMFTMRQRRTDPAWFGRAFAISMAVNAIGFPIGAAVAGGLAEISVGLAVLVGVVAATLATTFAAVLVPRTDDAAGSAALVAHLEA
jgi:hypothetical protein